MSYRGKKMIAADRKTVWDALNNPEILQQSMPGCSVLDGTIEEGFDMVVSHRSGILRLKFKGRVTVTNRVEEKSCTITGNGSSGPLGTAIGRANFRLIKTPRGTRLSYEVDASAEGKLAGMVANLIDRGTVKLTDQFIFNFINLVETPEFKEAQKVARRKRKEKVRLAKSAKA